MIARTIRPRPPATLAFFIREDVTGTESRERIDTMSLAYDILYNQKCRSTHHKLAMDALQHLRAAERERWLDLFLYYIDWYLEGAKAPDDKFKDFKNHVLHVKENFWGGACTSAREWYRKTLELFRRRDWPAACYSAGVLSHYFTDPFQPFHTGQTEAEGIVHRAQEWSICKAYGELRRLIDLNGGYPSFEVPDQDDWLEEMIRRGAIAAHEHYEVCIDHYNIDLGRKNPPAGLDDEIRERISKQIALATVGFARVLDRLIVDSCASADSVPVLITMALAAAQQPSQSAKDFVNARAERIRIEEMYAEFKATGKVVNTLPEDDRVVRKAHAAEVLQVPLFLLNAEKIRPPGSKHGTWEPREKKPVAVKKPRAYAIDGTPIPYDGESPAPVRLDPPSARPVPPPAYMSPPRDAPEALRPQPFMVGARSVTVGAPKREAVVAAPAPAVAPKPAAPPKAEMDDRKTAITPPVMPSRDPLADLPKPGGDGPSRPPSSRGIPPTPTPPVPPKREPEPTPVTTPPTPRNDAALASLIASSPPKTATETKPAVQPMVSPPTPPAETKAAPPTTAKPASAPPPAAASPPTPVSDRKLRFYLEADEDLEAAPSIGPKTAKRFEALGIKSVRDFLKQDAAAMAAKLSHKHMPADVIRDWQDQTRLALAIPNLRGHDAQILVGCGLREPKQVAAADAADLEAFVKEFVNSSEGQRVLRGGDTPDAKEIADWIAWAKDARTIAL